MQTRRNFIGNVATGLAGSFATGRALGANDRIRIGVIGMGERGTQLAREAIACPNTEFAASPMSTPAASRTQKTRPRREDLHIDYRQMLEDKSLDAVLIATPQHLHAECFIAAMDAGKHVYQEKAMAFTRGSGEAHARRIRSAPAIASCRSGIRPARLARSRTRSNYLASGASGTSPPSAPTCTATRRTANRSGRGPSIPDMTPENIDWKAFLGRLLRAISMPTATSTGVSSRITRAATCTKTCLNSSRSGTR